MTKPFVVWTEEGIKAAEERGYKKAQREFKKTIATMDKAIKHCEGIIQKLYSVIPQECHTCANEGKEPICRGCMYTVSEGVSYPPSKWKLHKRYGVCK